MHSAAGGKIRSGKLPGRVGPLSNVNPLGTNQTGITKRRRRGMERDNRQRGEEDSTSDLITRMLADAKIIRLRKVMERGG